MLLWPFTVVWPIWVPVLAWLTYGSLRPAVSRHAPEWRQRAPRGLWALLLAPLSVALWAQLGAGLGERPPGSPGETAPGWPMALLHGLAVLQLVLAVVGLYRYRAAWPYAVPTVMAALAYTALAWFVGAMSITNVWL